MAFIIDSTQTIAESDRNIDCLANFHIANNDF